MQTTPKGGTSIHVYLSNKNKSKLEKQHARYVSREDFDELKHDVISWNDIEKIVDFIKVTKKNTKSESNLPEPITSHVQEHTSQDDINVRNTHSDSDEDENAEIKQHTKRKSVTFDDDAIKIDDIPIAKTHANKKLPIPPSNILEKRKSLSGDVELNEINTPKIVDEPIKPTETITKTFEFPDITETKKIVASSYSPIKTDIELPNIDETKKIISDSHIPINIAVEIPDAIETKKTIAKAYSHVNTDEQLDNNKQIAPDTYVSRKDTFNHFDIPDIYETKEIVQRSYADDALKQCENILVQTGNIDKKLSDTIKEETKTHRTDIKTVFDVSVTPIDNDHQPDAPDFETTPQNNEPTDIVKIDDLIIKTRGEYEVISEYRKNVSDKTEEITHIPKSILPEFLNSIETPVVSHVAQQILIPISTKPVKASKKKYIDKKIH